MIKGKARKEQIFKLRRNNQTGRHGETKKYKMRVRHLGCTFAPVEEREIERERQRERVCVF